jgi:hypothetical protein
MRGPGLDAGGAGTRRLAARGPGPVITRCCLTIDEADKASLWWLAALDIMPCALQLCSRR